MEIKSITGGWDYVTITYDNGFAVKVIGELRPGATFIAYKKTIRKWEPPHEDIELTPQMADQMINDVNASWSPDKVKIIFE